MNIFAVDRDPVAAARALCDRHVVKMTLETAQILCTVAHALGERPRYKPTHRHHPCVIWAGARQANFRWLVRHGLALAAEYQRRYGGEHASERVIRWAEARGPQAPGRRQPFAQTMPEHYRGDDPVEAYRRFYRGEKARFASWRPPARPPAWWFDSAPAPHYIGRNVQAASRAAKKAERAGAGAVRREDAAVGGGGARRARADRRRAGAGGVGAGRGAGARGRRG